MVPAELRSALGAALAPRLGVAPGIAPLPPEAAALEAALARSPETAIVMIHISAVAAVAAAIQAGTAPAARLAAWTAEVEPLGALQRRYRRRLALLPAAAVLRDPGKAAWKALNHLGQGTPASGPAVSSTAASVSPPAPLDLALAQAIVAEDAAAVRLDGLLEAGSLLPEPPPEGPARAVADLAALRADLAAAGAARADAEAALAAQRDLLSGQLGAVREELHQRFLAAEAAEARVAELLGSTSWRITRPVRAVKLSLAGLAGRRG